MFAAFCPFTQKVFFCFFLVDFYVAEHGADILQYDAFDLLFRNGMRRAVFFAEVGISAAGVHIYSVASSALACQLFSAIGANEQTRQRMHSVCLVCLPSCSSVVDRLHFVPCRSVNDRFVRIFPDDLFALRYVQHFVVLIGKARRAVLSERADIRSVFENVRNGLLRPVGRALSVRLFSVQPRIVCRGIGDPFVG